MNNRVNFNRRSPNRRSPNRRSPNRRSGRQNFSNCNGAPVEEEEQFDWLSLC